MEELLTKFDELKKEQKWVEAVEMEMAILDKYPNALIASVSWNFKYTEKEMKELEKRGEKDRKVAYWVGHLKYFGDGGYDRNDEGAYGWFSRGAAAGHTKAIFWKGYMLWNGEGVTREREAALKCFEEAGTRGYGNACGCVAVVHKEAGRYFQAAIWYGRGVAFGDQSSLSLLRILKRERPVEICPWGEWRRDREYHSLVPPKVQEAVKTTLLLFKRLGITRYIAYQVCEYVVTRSGWN